MSKYIFLIVIQTLLQLFTSKIYSQSGNSKSLEIGNIWVYRNIQLMIGFPVDTSYVQEVVIRDTLINGIQYAIINHDFGYYSFERADSMKVYTYNTSIDSEYVLIDFSQQDTTGNNFIVEVDTIYFWNEERIEVCIDNWYSLNDYSICYTEGIGETASYSSSHGGLGYRTNIVAALLNGIQYGDTILLSSRLSSSPPINYDLSQNYPNPFNPATKIKYSIPTSGNVEIKIFDLLGNELIKLVNEYKISGAYEIQFDAGNLSSGIYFYRLISGKFSETKKMLLLR